MDEGAVVRLLRIGKYKAVGETVKVTLQINCEQQSPSFNHKNRTAQRKLFNDIRNDFMKYYFHFRIDDEKSNWLASDI